MSADYSDAVVIDAITKRFAGRRGGHEIVALSEVSLAAPRGSTLGIVGESGSGKSTLARCLLGLERPDSGEILVLGRSITTAKPKQLRAWRRDLQPVFQEPQESLNPRRRLGAAIGEPLTLHTDLRGAALRRRVHELMDLVALDPELYDRYPHQLSGGQQQRVNIARALATNPQVVILDEPTSSLDVSVRAGILDLLTRLQRELGLTYILISHDLLTIRRVCDRVAVLCRGRVVESGETGQVLSRPAHPYTRLLIGSELSLDLDVPTEVTEIAPPPEGLGSRHCVFAPRCVERDGGRCLQDEPELERRTSGQAVACFRADELATVETVPVTP